MRAAILFLCLCATLAAAPFARAGEPEAPRAGEELEWAAEEGEGYDAVVVVAAGPVPDLALLGGAKPLVLAWPADAEGQVRIAWRGPDLGEGIDLLRPLALA